MLSRLTVTVPKMAQFSVGFRYFTNTATKLARYGGNNTGFGTRMSNQVSNAQNFFCKTDLKNFQGFGVRSGPTLKERLLGPTTGKRKFTIFSRICLNLLFFSISLWNLCSRWSICIWSRCSHVLRSCLERTEYSSEERVSENNSFLFKKKVFQALASIRSRTNQHYLHLPCRKHRSDCGKWCCRFQEPYSHEIDCWKWING